MRTFIAKHQKSGLKVTFKYDFNGILRNLEFDGDWKVEAVKKIMQMIPADLATIIVDVTNRNPKSSWLFAETTDVSFDVFYQKYPKKVGRKSETEKAWNKLGETDKMEAFLFIEELINLKADGTAFPYPATYLNKKYWK